MALRFDQIYGTTRPQVDVDVREIDNGDASGPVREMKECMKCGAMHSVPSEHTTDGLSDFCSRKCLQASSSEPREIGDRL